VIANTVGEEAGYGLLGWAYRRADRLVEAIFGAGVNVKGAPFCPHPASSWHLDPLQNGGEGQGKR
jgi:hypothetical protein